MRQIVCDCCNTIVRQPHLLIYLLSISYWSTHTQRRTQTQPKNDVNVFLVPDWNASVQFGRGIYECFHVYDVDNGDIRLDSACYPQCQVTFYSTDAVFSSSVRSLRVTVPLNFLTVRGRSVIMTINEVKIQTDCSGTHVICIFNRSQCPVWYRIRWTEWGAYWTEWIEKRRNGTHQQHHWLDWSRTTTKKMWVTCCAHFKC